MYAGLKERALPSGRSICVILCSLLIRIVQWGEVAQWLDHANYIRVLMGSNPTEAVRKRLQLHVPHLVSVIFQRIH